MHRYFPFFVHHYLPKIVHICLPVTIAQLFMKKTVLQVRLE